MEFKKKITSVSMEKGTWMDSKTFIRIKNKGERSEDYPYLKKTSLYVFAQSALDAFSSMLKNTINEVKGFFTENELKAIVAAYNPNAISSQVQADRDFFCVILEYRSYVFDEAGIDWRILREKIRRLKSAQIYVLQFLLKSIGDNKEDVELFINDFSKSK